MTRLAARACVFIAVAHLLLSLAGAAPIWGDMIRTGLWHAVPAPWLGQQLERQTVFWTGVGSFAVPLLLLGFTIERAGRAPRALGWALLAYALAASVLAPVGGFWTLLLPAMLLIADRQPREARA